jgi:hypothetical protein
MPVASPVRSGRSRSYGATAYRRKTGMLRRGRQELHKDKGHRNQNPPILIILKLPSDGSDGRAGSWPSISEAVITGSSLVRGGS